MPYFPATDVERFLNELAALYNVRGRSSPLPVSTDKTFVAPAFRPDGLGIQALHRIALMSLADTSGATYLHIPLRRVQHQDCCASPADWVRSCERFLNLGADEFSIWDLAEHTGYSELADMLGDAEGYVGNSVNDWPAVQTGLILKLRNNVSTGRNIWLWDLVICRDVETTGLCLNENVVKRCADRFANNGYLPESPSPYDASRCDVAVHVRRGDVWLAHKAGDDSKNFSNKLVGQAFYVNLLKDLSRRLSSDPRPKRFHVFTDGVAEDFDAFKFVDHERAVLPKADGEDVDVVFHFHMNTFDSLYWMVHAPILVPGKSTFSVLAVILGRSRVFFVPEIAEFYQYRMLDELRQRDKRFEDFTP